MDIVQIETGIAKVEQYAAMVLAVLHMTMPNSTLDVKATQAVQLAEALIKVIEDSPLLPQPVKQA